MTVSEQPRSEFDTTEVGRKGRAYAFLIAFVSAVGGFLFGYDLAIMAGANISLREQFGLSEAGYGFSTASAMIGCVLGPFVGAWLCDRFGRRSTLIFACALLGIGTIFTAIPNDIYTFNIFRIVGGIGVGLCSIASPMYTNEIAPARWRGGLGFMYQLAIVVGSIAAAAATWLLGDWFPHETSWRWMFGSELVPVAVFLVLLCLIPESPRWLAQRGRWQDARRVFTQIDGPDFAASELAEVKASLATESGTFGELFGPGLRMALFVGLALALFNNFTGWSAVGGYVTDLFLQQGLSVSEARLRFTLAYSFMGLMTLVACGLVDRLGRRPLWLVSSVIMVFSNLAMGLVFYWQLGGWLAMGAFCLLAIPHSFALGPLPWLMMSEIFPTRIRARAVAVTTTFIWAVGFVATDTFPLLRKASEAVLGEGNIAGAFWFYSAACILSFLFGLIYLPETKGRTLEEIAESWKR